MAESTRAAVTCRERGRKGEVRDCESDRENEREVRDMNRETKTGTETGKSKDGNNTKRILRRRCGSSDSKETRLQHLFLSYRVDVFISHHASCIQHLFLLYYPAISVRIVRKIYCN